MPPRRRAPSRISSVAAIHGCDVTLARTIALALLALGSTPVLAHASAAPGPASPSHVFAPTRISVAILRAEGFGDRSELARAISLRLPGLTLGQDGE